MPPWHELVLEVISWLANGRLLRRRLDFYVRDHEHHGVLWLRRTLAMAIVEFVQNGFIEPGR